MKELIFSLIQCNSSNLIWKIKSAYKIFKRKSINIPNLNLHFYKMVITYGLVWKNSSDINLTQTVNFEAYYNKMF